MEIRTMVVAVVDTPTDGTIRMGVFGTKMRKSQTITYIHM